MKKDYNKELDLIKCECGYCNQGYNVRRYGTCLQCGRTLDEKARYKHEMYCRLHLWKKKGERR